MSGSRVGAWRLLTLAGSYLSSRVGRSLATAAGTPQSHVHSLKEYEDGLHALAAPDLREAELTAAQPRQAAPRLKADSFGTFSLPWDVAAVHGVRLL